MTKIRPKTFMFLIFCLIFINSYSQMIDIPNNLRDEKYSGEWVEYYEDEFGSSDKVKRKINFLNGVTNGDYIYYYKNGNTKEKGGFSEGKANGDWIKYFDNGQEEERVNYKMGKRNGEYIYYFDNGKIRIKGNYIDGVEDGEWIEYFENGNVKRKTSYINGKKTKVWEYQEDGTIKEKNYK